MRLKRFDLMSEGFLSSPRPGAGAGVDVVADSADSD